VSGLLVYGSLVNRLELERKNLDIDDKLAPVTVSGFKRVFAQEPSWRRSTGIDRAVLTVVEDENYYINAILVIGLNDIALKLIDNRERGYQRVHVCKRSIKSYQGYGNDLEFGDVCIYVGEKEKYNENLMPNPDYLSICTEGAKMWGGEFYDAFLKTTFIGKRRLNEVVK